MASSYDTENVLSVGSLGFPSTGYQLGVDSSGNVYSLQMSTNTLTKITMSAFNITLSSLTTGTFSVGTQYSMTAVFSTSSCVLSSITPPNSSDTISGVTQNGSTVNFNWTPQAVVTNYFQFVFPTCIVKSSNYTTVLPTKIVSFAFSGKTATSVANNITATFSNNLTANPTITPPDGSISSENVSNNICTFTWTPSTTNMYAYFNGSSYWTLTSPITLTAPCTIQFWVNCASRGGTDGYGFCGASSPNGYGLEQRSNVLYYANGFSSSNTVTDGTWHHCAASVTSASSVQYVIDGANSGSPGSWNGGVYNMYKIGTGWTMNMTGYMYDFRIYNIARTASQISSDMYNPPTTYTNMIAMWPMKTNMTEVISGLTGSMTGTISYTSFSLTNVTGTSNTLYA